MKQRDPNALRARQRKAGPMKHKNAPRGGERAAARREARDAAKRRQLRTSADMR